MLRSKRLRLVVAFGAALLLSFAALFHVADDPSEQYLEQSLQRALISFGTARALNGVISVAQGTQLALEPAGIGLNFSPGEILDPINDLIERFSWVMLAASSSLGVQKLMLNIARWWPVTLLLIICLAVGLWGLWRDRWQHPPFRRIVGRLLLLSMVLRFAVPAVSLTGDILYQQFMAPQYTEANAKLEQTRAEVDLLNGTLQPEAQEERGLFSRLGQIAAEVGDWRASLQQYQIAAERATRSTIDLIVIFVFQTAVLPLLFAWVLIIWVKAWFWRLGRYKE